MGRLGEDEHGVWLGAEAGSTARRGNEPPITYEQPSAQLIPPGQWWTAVFNAAPARTEIYGYISTPPAWLSADKVSIVDLDLNVLRARNDGRVLSLAHAECAGARV